MMPTQYRQAVVHAGQISVDIDLPDGTRVDIVVSPVKEKINAQTTEDLPGFGAAADFGDEVDKFNRWYREARQGGVNNRELEYWQ